MCLAVPGKVLEIWNADGTRMASVDFGGVRKEVCLEFVPDIETGDYAIVHVGFALQRLDEKSALETLALFERMGEMEMEFGDPWTRAAKESGMESSVNSIVESSGASRSALSNPGEVTS